MQKFVIRVFTCQNMAIFRNPSKFLNFFEFSKKNLIQIFSRVFKVTKKTVFTEITLQMWPWKIIENDQNFCRIFRFWAEISNFLVQIFFTYFTPQDLPLCKKSAPYFENLIFYQFLSILVENCQFWVTPPYFGPHVLTPLWSGPVPKKFHMVRKG